MFNRFHENFKKLRTRKNYSQASFAKAIGITRSAVGSYEELRAYPDYDTLILISKELKTPIDQLLKDEII